MMHQPMRAYGMPKAYSYTRFSTPEQAQGDSARRQIEAAREFAQRHGVDLEESLTFEDLGVSGFRGKNSEVGALRAFRDAVADEMIEEGSWLIVESLDRLSRNTPRKALRLLEEIVDDGVVVATTSDNQVYDKHRLDTDHFALMGAYMVAIRANEESRLKQNRLRAVWTKKRTEAADKPLTKVAPAWLRLKADRSGWDTQPEKVEVVRRIFGMAADGIGLEAIAKRLNEEGVPCFGSAVRWHKGYVSKIVTSPAAVGIFIPHTFEVDGEGKKIRTPQEPVEGYFPAVVDTALWQRVQARRRSTGKRASSADAAVRNPFAGLARCGRCGAAMTRINKGGGYETLACTGNRARAGCDAPYIKMESAWAIFASQVEVELERLSDDPDAGRLNNLEVAIGEMREEAQELAEQIGRGRSPALRDRLDIVEMTLAEMQAERRAIIIRMGEARHTSRERTEDRLREAVEAQDYPAVNENLRTLRVRLTWEGETRGIPLLTWDQQ